MHRRGNFVYHYWGFTLIYRPLSYPFRSLLTLLLLLFHVKSKSQKGREGTLDFKLYWYPKFIIYDGYTGVTGTQSILDLFATKLWELIFNLDRKVQTRAVSKLLNQ